MKKINENTKAYDAMHYEWENMKPGRDIFSAYGRPGINKIRSYQNWIRWIYDNFTVTAAPAVLSAGCQFYSIGFEFTDPDTGAVCFAKITRDNIRYIEL